MASKSTFGLNALSGASMGAALSKPVPKQQPKPILGSAANKSLESGVKLSAPPLGFGSLNGLTAGGANTEVLGAGLSQGVTSSINTSIPSVPKNISPSITYNPNNSNSIPNIISQPNNSPNEILGKNFAPASLLPSTLVSNGGFTTGTSSVSSPSTLSSGGSPYAGQISAIRDRLKKSKDEYDLYANPTEEENQAQMQIDALNSQLKNLNASKEAGLVDVENQTIPMRFITGQQAAMERQASAKAQGLAATAEPLTTKLARLQMQRQLQQKAKESQYNSTKDELDQLLEEEKANKPQRLEIGGNLIEYDPITGGYKTVFSAPSKENLPASVQEYEYAKNNGYKGSFTDYQNADANRKISVARSTNDSQGLVDTIIQNPGLFEQLTASEKARVAPALQQAGFSNFGKPLSDTAIKEISQSESALNNLADLRQKVKDNISYVGPISGLAALNPYSKARQIQADIDRIRQNVGKALEGGVLRKEDEEKYKKILATLNDTPETALYKIDQLIQSIQRDVENYKNNQKLGGRNVGSSDNDPLGLGFNQPLSTGKNGLNNGFKSGADITKIAKAIGQFESGGRYNAVGPDTGKGNKALGKYQVMASNVPSWTKEALGKSLTPQQFLNSPEAQDAVAQYKMNQYYQKYGTVEDVASVWFSGRPVSKAGNAKDVIGTSVPKYISNVRAIYDRLG